MVAAFSLSMAGIQFFLFLRGVQSRAALLAVIMSLGGAAAAMLELGIAKTQNPETAQLLIFFLIFALASILIPMVWFVHAYLDNDRPWLARIITALWAFAVAVNVVMPGNQTFTSIEEMRQNTSFWGETWSQPIGEPNPFRWVADVATLLIVLYVADAARQTYKSGNRNKALVIGGAILFFIISAGIQAPLVDFGILQTPYMISWAFVAIAIALGMEVAFEAARAASLKSEIRAGEARWHALVENVQLGVLGASVDGEIAYSNRFMEDMLGYNRDQFRGRNVADFAPESFRNELAQRIQRARKVGPQPRTVFPLVDVKGNVRQIRWSFVASRDPEGLIDGYMAICEDVSELRKAETELRASERDIERFNRAALLVEFASGLAHELNQPLAAILSNAQAGRRILEEDDPPIDEIRSILDDIADDDMRAGKIIQSMRRMLQQSELEKKPVELPAMIADLRHIFESELQMSGIELVTEIPEDIPQIYAGRVEIQQVLLNLFSNAIKVLAAEDAAEPQIKIAARNEDERIHITLSDNGPGLDDGALEKIFQPFYSTSKDGLGMGLPISRRIVELHDSTLQCRSAQGKGVEFAFSLPVFTPAPELTDAQ